MYCLWRGDNKLMQEYHDDDFGKIKMNTNELFKWLSLEQAQAGLSWQTVLNKEHCYDEFFDNFDVNIVANFDYEEALIKMQSSGIIKNKLKLKAVINGANLILKIEETQRFFDFIIGNIDTKATLDENVNNLVKVMKKLGFKFIGYEIIKSFLQSIGVINNHEEDCEFYQDPYYILKDE